VTNPENPLIGCPVVVTDGDFKSWVGVVKAHETEPFDTWVIDSSHQGRAVLIAVSITQFRPLAIREDGLVEVPEELEEAPGEAYEDEAEMPSVPVFGMSQHEAANYTAQYIAGVAQIAKTFKIEGGYLEFESQDFSELLSNFQVSLMEQAAVLAAMSVRVARLYNAYQEDGAV
jgi:hypothetical protein